MADVCVAQIQACAIRATRLEANGVPDPGANNLYTSDALISLGLSPVVEEGQEFIVRNACGDFCINYKDRDRIKRYALTLELCTPDPYLSELLQGGTVLTDGGAVGYAYPPLGDAGTDFGISLEVWTRRIDTTGNADVDFPWARWVLPRCYLAPDDKTFENAPQSQKFKGFAVENENWYDGPLNDWPVASDRAVQWIPVTSLPAAHCGYDTIAVS